MAKKTRIRNSAVGSDSRQQLGGLKSVVRDTLKKKYKDPAFGSISYAECKLYVWRINQRKLESVQPSDYGKFYDGDSYLILDVNEGVTGEMNYDIFMWIGKYSTIDEYTTVAVKSAELDNTILNGCGTQHREVQENESELFLELFPKFVILKGGHDPAASKQRGNTSLQAPVTKLFHISGYGKSVKMVEVSYRYENLNSDDVFILDCGHTVYQLNGKNSNQAEKMWAIRRIQQIKIDNPKIKHEVIDEGANGFEHSVIKQIPRKNKATLKKKIQIKSNPRLYRLTDSSGSIEFKFVKEKPFKKSDLDPADVFIFDSGRICYVWIGKKASDDERHLALVYGNLYLKENSKIENPIQVVRQGREKGGFWAAFL